jgi:hypothetical protein
MQKLDTNITGRPQTNRSRKFTSLEEGIRTIRVGKQTHLDKKELHTAGMIHMVQKEISFDVVYRRDSEFLFLTQHKGG